ncbi:MAG: 2Fe-2S iron-sulfur cluster binding domain-containing protein, partial [Actinobacteria bacterium]|nr:2Fe-2S iron-sulfur cluster binding domain-containing protein [Actinomycetota bacterium]
MKNKIKIDVEPIGKRIFLDGPENTLDAIREAGIGIKSVCAGKGKCGKCRIILLDKSRNAPNEREQKILTGDEIQH